ncbi:hypothetical protein P378_14620 [Desulforamulus profundi]|uniref:Uncharacterized protein n=1 Tax=Desulforamulus profundi TaxID=1383067 RepID=A0A2C6MDP0_9FIRM|nr:hypothetical protein [Desulforamulus profundi]PHJ37715.1 hypothetical protein P378_14620 [Desulforamulus profundi]
MRIISIRKGFTSDHSSTSYEFLALDKTLGKKEKAEVASLSRRADPTSRRVSFTYHVDGYDIPGGWENLMAKYYDVMYREDYDWWTFALAFNTTQEQLEDLYKYEFSGDDDLGITVESIGNRAVVAIYCRVDMAYIDDSYDEYEDYYGDENEEDEGDGEEGVGFVAEDELLNLLVQVRQQLMNGDYRTLYAVWEKYGGFDNDGEGEFDIPIPQDKKTGKNVVEQFRNILN